VDPSWVLLSYLYSHFISCHPTETPKPPLFSPLAFAVRSFLGSSLLGWVLTHLLPLCLVPLFFFLWPPLRITRGKKPSSLPRRGSGDDEGECHRCRMKVDSYLSEKKRKRKRKRERVWSWFSSPLWESIKFYDTFIESQNPINWNCSDVSEIIVNYWCKMLFVIFISC